MTATGEWTGAHTRYMLAELAAGAVVTAALSCAFAWAIFGRSLPIDADDAALQIDALVQALIVAFMSALVPTLLARRRVARGLIAALRPADRAWSPVVRSLAIALCLAPLAAAVHLLASVALLPSRMNLAGLLVWKSLFGVAVATVSTAVGVNLALRGSKAVWRVR